MVLKKPEMMLYAFYALGHAFLCLYVVCQTILPARGVTVNANMSFEEGAKLIVPHKNG